MSSKPRMADVHVDATIRDEFLAGLDDSKREDYSGLHYVRVTLRAAEMALAGDAFRQAVRKALQRDYGNGKVMFWRKGKVGSHTKTLGFLQFPDNVEFDDRWAFAPRIKDNY